MAAELIEKTTPEDVSEFDREQLRFFLTERDLSSTLAELNPSLAWLPAFGDMNLLKDDATLAGWVQRNFDSIEAIREVVANLRFFKDSTADILDFHLNRQRARLSSLYVRSWELIIRHIRNSKRGLPRHEWFDLMPRLKRGDYSTETLERIVKAATPKLFVEKRFMLHDPEPRAENGFTKPSDLFQIKYSVDEGISEKQFFEYWSDIVPAETESRLINMLGHSLADVLADAEDVGVEMNQGLSISDVDVPSVADHEQNAYRGGFLTIVRMIAELWSQLIGKDELAALEILNGWVSSRHRLVHRLALYAAADERVPSETAAHILLVIPAGELFLTNSSVEVHRLIRERWGQFSPKDRAAVEKRIFQGPPRDWFYEGADIGPVVDRKRLELLAELERLPGDLTAQSKNLLGNIRQRHPNWVVSDLDRLGFTMWSGGVRSVVGDKERLAGIPSAKLIEIAERIANEASFTEGDAWEALCRNEPVIAFQGIVDAPETRRWHQWAWRPLLWNSAQISDVSVLNQMAELLVQWPTTEPVNEILVSASWWLDDVVNKLKPAVLWRTWDFIEKRAPRNTQIKTDDPYSTAVNDASGHLASVLLKATEPAESGKEFDAKLLTRYNKLVEEPGTFGLLARVSFAASLPFLFDRAPAWTTKVLVPGFFWDSPDAAGMWSARKYSNAVGQPELFRMTKKPFLELFSRNEPSKEDRRVFADWLGVILVSNISHNNEYPLTLMEARSVLRQVDPEALSSFAHRLAIEMQGAKKGEKEKVWKEYIGPVFLGAWPLDAEIQSERHTFKLVQMLAATGKAFGEAADVVLPFIRSEEKQYHTSMFPLADASNEVYLSAPQKMLNLLAIIAGDAPPQSVFSLREALDKLRAAAPEIATSKKFLKLEKQAALH